MHDVLWVQMVFFPVTLVNYIVWWVSWIWRFNFKKEQYGIEEQIYLICKNMSIKRSAWESFEEDVQEKYLNRELWIKVIRKSLCKELQDYLTCLSIVVKRDEPVDQGQYKVISTLALPFFFCNQEDIHMS